MERINKRNDAKVMREVWKGKVFCSPSRDATYIYFFFFTVFASFMTIKIYIIYLQQTINIADAGNYHVFEGEMRGCEKSLN